MTGETALWESSTQLEFLQRRKSLGHQKKRPCMPRKDVWMLDKKQWGTIERFCKRVISLHFYFIKLILLCIKINWRSRVEVILWVRNVVIRICYQTLLTLSVVLIMWSGIWTNNMLACAEEVPCTNLRPDNWDNLDMKPNVFNFLTYSALTGILSSRLLICLLLPLHSINLGIDSLYILIGSQGSG